MPISMVAASCVPPRAISTGRRLDKEDSAEISSLKRYVSPGSARLALVMKQAASATPEETTQSHNNMGRTNMVSKVKLPSRHASLSQQQKKKGGAGKMSKVKELALRHQRSSSAIRACEEQPSLIPKATQSSVISSPYRKRPTNDSSPGDQLSMYKVVSQRFSIGISKSPSKESVSSQDVIQHESLDLNTSKQVSKSVTVASEAASKRNPSRVQKLRDMHILTKTSSDDSFDHISLQSSASKDMDYQIRLMAQKLEIAQQEINALENRMNLQKHVAEKDVREQERKCREAIWERDESRKESTSLKQQIEKFHEEQRQHMDVDQKAMERILFLEQQIREERKRADLFAQAHESKVQSLIKERDESRSEISRLHQELHQRSKSETALKNREVELQVKTKILESKFERELRRAEKIFEAHEAKLKKVVKQRNDSRSQAASLAEELRKLRDDQTLLTQEQTEPARSLVHDEEMMKLQKQLRSVIDQYETAVAQVKDQEEEISSLLAQIDNEKKHSSLIKRQLEEKTKELKDCKLETDCLREKLVCEQEKWNKVQETVDAAEAKLQTMHFKNEDYIDEITYLKKELAVAIAHDAEEQERELQMVEELKEVAMRQQKYRAQIAQLRSEQVGDKEKIKSLQEQVLVQQEMVGVMKEETEENEGCMIQQNEVIQKLTEELRTSHTEHEYLAQQLQSVAAINHETSAKAGTNFDSFQLKVSQLFAAYALLQPTFWTSLLACLGVRGFPTANDFWHLILCLGSAFIYRQLVVAHSYHLETNSMTFSETCPQIEQSMDVSVDSEEREDDEVVQQVDSTAETMLEVHSTAEDATITPKNSEDPPGVELAEESPCPVGEPEHAKID